jgi:hypothetical protein
MRWMLLALGLIAVAPAAHGYPLYPEGVAWPFEGRGFLASGGPEYAVSGELRFHPFGLTSSLSASVGASGSISGGSYQTIVEDGVAPSADLIHAPVGLSENFSFAHGSILHPLGAEWGFGLLEIRLIDIEGGAFDGLAVPNVPPAHAPDASLFDVREITIWQYRCSVGSECLDTGIPEIVFTITIDWLVPEAGAPLSIALGLAALLAWSRLNRTLAE